MPSYDPLQHTVEGYSQTMDGAYWNAKNEDFAELGQLTKFGEWRLLCLLVIAS